MAQLLVADGHLPATKPGTMVVEGESQDITLQLFSQPGVPLVTYYPDSLIAESICSGEGCGVWFYPQATYEAEVHYFLPSGDPSIDDIDQAVTGDNGWLASNGWIASGEYTDPSYLAYPWAQKVILFQGATAPVTGAIYIGEENGVAFRATVMFALEAGDGFAPIADMILSNTQIESAP
jgi:hypothetical protein